MTIKSCLFKQYAWPLGVLLYATGCAWVQTWIKLPEVTGLSLYTLLCVLNTVISWGVLSIYISQDIVPLTQLHFIKKLALYVWGLSAMFVLGVMWSVFIAHAKVSDGWPAALEGQDISAQAIVKTMPNIVPGGQTAWFELVAVKEYPELQGKTLSLAWYGQHEILQPAQQYQIMFRAKQRHGNLNPNGFDYEFWLVQRGIAATGYLRQTPVLLSESVYQFLPWVEQLRTYLRAKVFDAAPNIRAAQWVASLALGDQRSLQDADWQMYNATGTGHLLAVSGSHIMMLGALLAWLAGKWWSLSSARLLRTPRHIVQARVLLISSVIYALMSGWALPAQRTALMLSVAALAQLYSTRASVWHVLACTGFVALLFDPMAILSPSFWLSYGAVAVLVSLQHTDGSSRNTNDDFVDTPQAQVDQHQTTVQIPLSLWSRAVQFLGIAAHQQIVLTLALFPVGAFFFHQISFISPIANAVAIPVIGWITTPLTLLATIFTLVWPALATVLMQAVLLVQNVLDAYLNFLQHLPFAQMSVPQGHIVLSFLGMSCAVGCVFLRNRLRWTALAGIPICLALQFIPTQQDKTTWQVVFLDVGQGMATMVHSQGHTLLFDAGPRYNGNTDSGSRTIVPYLNAKGVTEIDHVILSHADEDHTGGATSLAKRLPVLQWWGSLASFHPLRSVIQAPIKPCIAGEQTQWAGLTLRWLHPPPVQNFTGVKPNSVSCVLHVSDGHHSVLLTGDIEAAQELALVAHYGTSLAADVLLAPHHGSKTSSTAAFLEAVAPKHVVMQNGYRNRFGHPHPTVTERYAAMQITQWRNDVDGAVLVHINDELTIQAWRTLAQRYWHTVLPKARSTADGVEE